MDTELKALICMSCSGKDFSFRQNEGPIPNSLISNYYVMSKTLFYSYQQSSIKRETTDFSRPETLSELCLHHLIKADL